MPTLLMMDQRDDTASEAQKQGDYFFLFEREVDYAKAKREPRRKRLFRRFTTRRSKEWRPHRLIPYDKSPDTTALMSEDEHSLMHSCHLPEEEKDYSPHIIWPETMSLVGSTVSGSTTKRKTVLMKKWKSRMGRSLRKALLKKQDARVDAEEEETGSIVDRARKTLSRRRTLRAKAALYEDEIGLYVHSTDEDVETVYRSTFEHLCVPSFTDDRDVGTEPRDGPPSFPETVELDNGYGVARLLHQGNTALAVNYDSDFAQLQLQSEDEYGGDDDDDDDDDTLTDERMLPHLGTEETEYNLFPQSSTEEDNAEAACYPSLLAQSSTVSEDPSLFDDALCSAYPLPQYRQMRQEVVLVESGEDPTLFMQSSSCSEDFSETSYRLGAGFSHPSHKEHEQRPVKSSSSGEDRRLGIACPAWVTETTLEDAAAVWSRIYAPPAEDLPSPTPVQKSRSPWGCGLDASPLSVKSDITESEAGAPDNHFYNIRRYTSCGVIEEDDHPFDEVDTNKSIRRQAPARTSSFGCGVPDMVRSSLYHKEDSAPGKRNSPVCECVKCSVSTMYASLLWKT